MSHLAMEKGSPFYKSGLVNKLFIICTSLLVAACGNYSGSSDSSILASAQACAAASSSALPAVINTAGQNLYQQQCSSCHGDSGYGTPSGPSLIGCSTCGSAATLTDRIATTMPVSDVESCGLECSQNTAEYIMQAFNGSFGAVSVASASCSLDGVGIEPETKTLYRSSLSLASTIPEASTSQANAAVMQGSLSEEIDKMMETDAFLKRIMEIYNDVLHQDKYLPGEDALNLLDSNDYPSRRWYRDLGLDTSTSGPDRDLYYWLRDHSNDAVSQEALRLIAHVVKNNRPFTEILTADYTMANRYSAEVYGVASQASFRNLDAPKDPRYAEDPEDFEEVRIPGIPHAGILTSPMFLNRFPTTSTNLNRHRSRKVFEFFLDTDILAIPGSRPDQSTDLVSTTPTLDNASCVGCHDVMDPVASAFQNWDSRGRYRPSRLSRDGWPSDIQPRGFNGVTMPLSGNADSSLQWAGKQIASDPRFARATIKTLFKGLVGQDPLIPPGENASEDEKAAYGAQRLHLGEIETQFISSNYNLKVAVKGILMSPYYRAASASGASASVVGDARLLTPEMLDRKIEAVTGYQWKNGSASYTYLNKERGQYNQVYGGIDSDATTKRITQPNGLMAAVQRLMAVEMSCSVVTKDFFYAPSERKLFPYVAIDTQPTNSDGMTVTENVTAIRKNLAHLYWRFYGEELSADSPELDESYQLFTDILSTGQALVEDDYYANRNLSWRCDLTNDPKTGDSLPSDQRIQRDEAYTIRAWMGVLTSMLSDFRFLYE